MTTEALKSTAVTALETTPPTRYSPGAGGPGFLRSVDGAITSTTAMTAGSTYRMARVRSDVKVKHVFACLDASITTFTCDIGVYYSNTAPTPASLQGTVILAALFGSAVDLHAIITPTDYVFESTTYVAAKRMQPLWQAAGLTADPKCELDIVLTNTATNSGAAVCHVEVQFVE